MKAFRNHAPPRASRSTLAAALASALATAAGAQQAAPAAASAQLEEVVVTAQRRQERLQDTPIAITVLDAQSLAERGAGDLIDVARIAPNVSLAAGSGGSGASFNTDAFIRGVGQFDWLITTDPGVGVYIDGVFFPRATGALLDLVDIQRVEVLRGRIDGDWAARACSCSCGATPASAASRLPTSKTRRNWRSPRIPCLRRGRC